MSISLVVREPHVDWLLFTGKGDNVWELDSVARNEPLLESHPIGIGILIVAYISGDEKHTLARTRDWPRQLAKG